MSNKLSDEDVSAIKETLLAAKFALEQDDRGPEKQKALKKINNALDRMRKA